MDFINPDGLDDIFASGPMSMIMTETFAILSFTQIRVDMYETATNRPTGGEPKRAVVVARIAIPIENARQLHGLLQAQLFQGVKPAGNA